MARSRRSCSPQKTLLEIQEQFQDRYNEIMRQHGFDYMEGAKTGAVVCALLVKVYALRRKDLEPKLAASIVSMGFVEGAKTRRRRCALKEKPSGDEK